ncbi:acyl-[ACP]--phospholipid O-acyltransferase [Roseospira marina]|uniref:Acyl-[ACP]--phospholipid O-acyltransferase n=1 Tax=Roseospira marina TaxID=140057 RepID=A0A5M6IBQ0_9PROT|nr:acyl-[ACP]--phospholipid O-acyltransferase [Roseospira marina]KAA5605165.1 acyl-[ACP]--phospholipid O-acyltransferase [Roseospira marina]MBB4314922.1 acyl-[acyl-carrier-protein]-phospholipid O-acyltransferase/long-chain-fatty-acid--[acyl-carrier-protein] ligase [Roseospira marina]MBB5087922.1 acyl-[acyl-carrier-protein]-phospholipid O-acyltransferase/long-chain-fatty-acid--[acyl-carrier-protein] ligase [Roseospira marina]
MTRTPLIGSRRFLPLLVTQSLGAFNDNLFKNALVVLVLYQLAATPQAGPMLVTAAMGLFILPWLLFSGVAGAVADKVEKPGLTRWLKGAEIAIMGLGAAGFLLGNVPMLMVTLFLMGTQSALLGPVKFALLPELLRRDELLAGNAYIEAAAYLAILGGTIAGGLLVVAPGGPLIVSGTALMLATVGLVTSLFIPRGVAKQPGLVVPRNPLAASWRTVAAAITDREVFRALMAIAWFHLLGATFLAQFPAYAKSVFHGDAEVVTLFLTVFSIGVALGAALCKPLLRGAISARLAPLALIGAGVAAFDLVAASYAVVPPTESGLIGAAAFLASPANWRILVDLLVLSTSGGLLIVPLYALIQDRTPDDERARGIAASNILNALFIVLSTAGAAGLLALGLTPIDLFLIAAVLNVGAIILAIRAWPETILRGLFKTVFKLAFRVRVQGLEHLEAAPKNAVVVANHLSYLDGPILAAWLPGAPMFAVHKQVAGKWWARPFMALIRRAEIEPGNPYALKAFIRAAKAGERCVIFPEGRLSVTGGLMKVYDGPAVVADTVDVPIVPVRIDGTQYSRFSKLGDKLRQRWFPRVTVTILPARRLSCPEDLTGANRRHALGQALYDTMSALVFETAPTPTTLPEALRRAARRSDHRTTVVEDATGTTLSYGRLRTAAVAMSTELARATEPEETVGVLLPTMAATLVSVFGLLEAGRVPAMLNFSAGLGPVTQACTAAGVRRIVTSRAFVEQANLSTLIEGLPAHTTVLYLEDIKARIGWSAKLRAAARARFGRPVHTDPNRPAVVLFTSGSEGTPKGVVLSHANLLANCRQLQARIAFSPADKVFNPLPMFHAFGLTGGVLLPLLHGVPVFLYPSPLHYRAIPELVYNSRATVLFGTDTFLAGYGKAADAYDLSSVRLVFAGAERVKPTTRTLYAEKFGLRLLEGYGATECGPVIAVNTPMHHKPGTVGRLLPGLDARLEPVDGVESGARLRVRGPNVMLGYLRVERPGHLEAPTDGWYDTGDIVDRDANGFLTLVDRAKRFAKVAGEMVSLGAVEQVATARWPDAQHAAIALPCPRKGERILLATTSADVNSAGLREDVRAQGRSELSVPSRIVVLDALPLLPSGKADYRALTRMLDPDDLDAAA